MNPGAQSRIFGASAEAAETLMDRFQGRLLLVEPDQSYNAVLELERWERDRSNHELAFIVEAVNRLLQTLPQGQIS